MTDLGSGISRSIEMLSGAIMHQAQSQNVFYQQHQHGHQPMPNNGAYSQFVQQAPQQNNETTYFFK